MQVYLLITYMEYNLRVFLLIIHHVGYNFRFKVKPESVFQLLVVKAQCLRAVDFDFPDLLPVDELFILLKHGYCPPLLLFTFEWYSNFDYTHSPRNAIHRPSSSAADNQ